MTVVDDSPITPLPILEQPRQIPHCTTGDGRLVSGLAGGRGSGQVGQSLQLRWLWSSTTRCSPARRRHGSKGSAAACDAGTPSARCPELLLLERNPDGDIRSFEMVLSAFEEVSAGVTPIRPGLCALGVPSRFYGGEAQAAAVVAEHLVACRVVGLPDRHR